MVCNSRICYFGFVLFSKKTMLVRLLTERYCMLLDTFLRSRLDELDDRNNVWFQQDGATAHTSGCLIGILREMFPSHLISSCSDISWPAQSPDLNPWCFSQRIPKSKGIHSSPSIYWTVKRCYLPKNCCHSTWNDSLSYGQILQMSSSVCGQ